VLVGDAVLGGAVVGGAMLGGAVLGGAAPEAAWRGSVQAHGASERMTNDAAEPGLIEASMLHPLPGLSTAPRKSVVGSQLPLPIQCFGGSGSKSIPKREC
jgi:hypothetical protein